MRYISLFILCFLFLSNKNLDKKRENINEIKSETRILLAQVYESNKKIRKIRKQFSSAQEKILKTEVEINELAEQIAQTVVYLEKEKKSLSKKLVYIYKLQSKHILSLVFSKQMSEEFLDTLKSLHIITLKDKESLIKYQKINIALKEQREILYEKMSKLLKKTDENKKLSKHIIKQQKMQRRILSKKHHLLNKEILDLNQIDFKDKKAFFEFKNHLPYPVKGSVTKKFGIKVDPVYKYKTFHKGIFISSKNKSPVKAIFDGKVDYVGFVKGYGKVLILNHGYHYYSLYSHLSRFSVKKNQILKQGDLLGLSGRSSLDHGPGIYFQINHFSDAVSPEKWLKKI